jgi:site-specific recombinase XerD
VAWIDETDDPTVQEARKRDADFLRPANSDGERVDFHALRHTFLSRLGRSGASAKVMQTMARHSTVTLTLDRYTHVALHDLDAAVNAMPSLPVTQDQKTLRAAGA